MAEVDVPVDAVRATGRHRKDLGDIEALAKSIEAVGLMNAITVTPEWHLIAGERRLAAYRLLGRTSIPARVVDTVDDAARRIRMERDENTQRKAMAPSELVALARSLEALERPRAAERRSSALINKRPVLQNMTAEGPTGATRDVVASALGTSYSTIRRAAVVVDAAADGAATEDERLIAKQALEDMDTGVITVSAAHDRVIRSIATKTGPIHRHTIESAATQRRAISSAEAALSGLAHGLRQIAVLHPDITSEEAAQWVGSLSESRRALTTLINNLKERTNAQS